MMQIIKDRQVLFFALVRLLGSPIVRLGVIFLFFVLSIYIGYQNAYAPFKQGIELPSAFSENNTRLDTTTLDVVTAATIDGQERSAHNFALYRNLFSYGAGQ